MEQTTSTTTPIGKQILVNVVLDKSGSMKANQKSTIEGYNEYLAGLRTDTDTQYNVSLTQFDAPQTTPELTISYIDKPLSEITDLTAADYKPRGMTPLYDAIGETIRRVESKGRPILCVIITDGHENSSKEFSLLGIKEQIKEKEAEGWTFVFLGADINAYQVAQDMGMNAMNASIYDPAAEQVMFRSAAHATQSYAMNRRASASVGQVKGEQFWSKELRARMSSKNAPVGGGPIAPPRFRPQPPATPSKRTWNITKQQ